MCLSKIISALKGKSNQPALNPIPSITPPVWKPTTEYQFTSQDIANLCLGAKDHVYTWDSIYWTVNLEDWKKIISDVLNNKPIYLAEKFDCEDFAFLCMSRITEKYQLNCCGVAVGMSPLGYHGFNVFTAWEGDRLVLHILEPQTGTIDPPGYTLDTIIFG